MQLTPAHITILGGDVRYSYCAQQLRQAGWQVDTFQVQGSPDTMALPGLFQPQRDYLLPYPAFNARGYIPFLQGEAILHCSDLIQGPITGSRFLCGRPGAFAQQLQNAGAQVLDYEKDEFLTTANAIPTAEGALALAMQQMPDTLWESRCLVLGFGRVGKQLSLRLQRLGARVTVAVRNDADRALLEALGLAHDTVAKYRSPLGQYRAIFNTVPAPVFTPAQYDTIDPACVLIDLASAPGGIDASQCLRRSLQFTHARGLPGKTAPATAGRLIAQTVARTLTEQEAL